MVKVRVCSCGYIYIEDRIKYNFGMTYVTHSLADSDFHGHRPVEKRRAERDFLLEITCNILQVVKSSD